MQLALLYSAMLALVPLLCVNSVLLASLASCTNCEEQLEIAKLTTTLAELAYTADGSGIRVSSAQESLYITKLDGRSIVSAEARDGGSLRLISLAGNTFIQATKTGTTESRDFYLPDAFAGALTVPDIETLRELVRVLNASSNAQESNVRLWDSLLTVLRYPETDLLQNAAAALGNTGVTGLEYPSVLPFYMTALQLSQLMQRSNVTGVSRWRRRGVTEDCLNECPPCPNQECLGLCGYGCNCWKWVCGDCCYHLGCYEHDICCREKFVQTACLFPFKFQCENGYSCN